MHHFDEEDHEPVAVVRTLSDFALALTLVVLMLIGTRSSADARRPAETRAAVSRLGATNAELSLVMMSPSNFNVPAKGSGGPPQSAVFLAGSWISAHPNVPATIVLQFQQKTLATDLHQALLNLQSAFGTNLARIDTVPLPLP